MANKIILKKSAVKGKAPTAADLEFGEVALNFADGKLYFKTPDEEIDFIGKKVNRARQFFLGSL